MKSRRSRKRKNGIITAPQIQFRYESNATQHLPPTPSPSHPWLCHAALFGPSRNTFASSNTSVTSRFMTVTLRHSIRIFAFFLKSTFFFCSLEIFRIRRTNKPTILPNVLAEVAYRFLGVILHLFQACILICSLIPQLLLFSVTWPLCHYLFLLFLSQSQILSGKVQACFLERLILRGALKLLFFLWKIKPNSPVSRTFLFRILIPIKSFKASLIHHSVFFPVLRSRCSGREIQSDQTFYQRVQYRSQRLIKETVPDRLHHRGLWRWTWISAPYYGHSCLHR